MRVRRALVAAVLLILVTPAAGQEGEPYFSLNSDRTYAPGEKPSIQVHSYNVDSLEFRVYRVNDPLAFFEKLEQPHAFGGRAPRLPRRQTWLERFHNWKREVRADIRDFFRAQYTADSRTKIRDWWLERQREPAPGPATTEFAQVPVLNQQQLVSKWRQRVRPGRSWESVTVPVQVPGKGLYVVEAVHGQLRAYTLVSVTELGIVTKSAPGRIVAFVQNRVNGIPAADCPIIFRTNRKEIARARTDGEGLAEVSLSEARPEDTLVLTHQGDDFAVASLYSWYLSSDPNRYLTGYIYTDRPVYRPGHTVYFKAILRTQFGAAYRLPELRRVTAEIQDPESNVVYRRELALSANGTLQGELVLPETTALGYYSVIVHAGDATVDGGFNVEEYKKPEYEVRVTPESKRVLQGDSIRATLEARYYYGEPVAGGRVTYVVHTSRYWYSLYADEVSPEEEEGDEGYYYGGEQVLEEQGRLDAEGKIVVTIPTSVSDRKWDVRYHIEARVTDAANREISGRNFVLATYGSFLVRIRPDQYVYGPGDKARLQVEARDYDGNPVAAPVRVELHRWHWNEPESVALFQTQSRTDQNGVARVEVPLRDGGSFTARVIARTPEGRDVVGRAYVWVTGGAAWYGERRERVQIVPDKKSYKPGDVARVLIVTGAPDAHVLVTAEGRALHSRQVVRATGPTVTVQIPVGQDFAPNFFVSATFLRDNQLYQGNKKVKVPPLERQLTVEVQSSKPQYQPGEPALYTVAVRDHGGRPVAGSELSLGVVDEAIYAIRPEAARDIVQFFYGEDYNRVNTNSSLSYYFHGEAGKRAMQLAGVRRRSDLAQLKPERLVDPKIRKAFPDTVFWAANLTTDSAGRAQARLSFPDSLTTWRATARAITRDTKVGSTVQRVIVRKNLILRLAVPRFFTEGDEVTLSALVHNYLATEKKARVSLEVEGLEILEGETRDMTVPSGGDAQATWRVRAKPGREVKLLGKALTNEESDAIELTLPVIPFGVKLSEARAGSIPQPSGEAAAELAFPALTVPTSRTLEIRVTPSLGGAIFGALEYLTGYPYGCTEQTMSRFLPSVVVAQTLRELGLKSNVDEAELQKKVREGLRRLQEFQHDDGGWGWWPTDESHAFMTAYVITGLALARQAGYPVREYDLDRARTWLHGAFDREKATYADLRAYMAYVLVLSAPSGAKGPDAKDQYVLNVVWEQRKDLTPYGAALLGLAFDTVGDSRAKDLAAQLESQARQDELEAYWTLDRDTLMDFYGDASPEVTAYAMKLLSRHRPSSPLLPKAAAWLVNHRNEGYYWYSTKQTAMVIFGLMDYLKAGGELRPNFSVNVWVNDRQVLSQRFTEADALAPTSPVLRIAADQLDAGANRIRIQKSGEGRLYWSARAEYFSTEEKLARTGTVALNLLREYFRLVPQFVPNPIEGGKSQKIVYRLEPLAGPVAIGDVIVVRLTVSGGQWRYLVVEDPIPAGTEFIERDDLYEIQDKPSWWSYYFSRREFHDDHAAIFQSYFRAGQTQHLYLLKVVNPGRFRVSPARVQPMYQPQYLAATDSKVVEVSGERSKEK
jgi:hypothetical protein